MKKLVKAVFTLSLFTFIERVLGFLFKIYLSRQLGAELLGVYQVSLSFFLLLLTLTTSGIPLVVSKMTAQCRAKKELCVEGSISTAALIISMVLSIVTCVFVVALNKPIGALFADDGSRIILLLMLPSLIFSALYSSFRGNLWGRQKYTTVSLLELAEQIARIGACIMLFAFGMDKLVAVGVSMSAGCFVAAAACVVCYFATGARLRNPRGNILPLIKSSAPITASRAATAAMGSIIAVAAPFLLIMGGLSGSEAMYEFGYSVGMALPLLYMPLTIISSLAFVMIPTLSQAVAQKDQKTVRRQTEGAIRISVVVATLFFPLFFALGEPLGVLVYNNADSGRFLAAAAWLLLPISIENITSSLMNSLDMEVRGLVNYLVGSAVMFAIFFIAGKYFSVNIMSIGMGVSWLLSSALNLFAMRKKAGISLKPLLVLLPSVAVAVPSLFLTKWLFDICEPLSGFLRLAVSGGLGFVFITVLSFLFGLLKVDFFVSERKKNRLGIKGRGPVVNS